LACFLGSLLTLLMSLTVLAEPPTDTLQPIRFGVLSIAPPARTHANWQPFVKYMSRELGRPVEIVVPRGFGKMKKAAAAGKVDFFYVNSLVFLRLKEAGKAIGLAQMENISGKPTTQAAIFVRRDSGITHTNQLKGSTVTYVAPMGASYVAARAYLYEQGLNAKGDTKEVFTKNLSSSIHKVLLGEVNVETMCGVNYKLMSKKVNTGELKRIAYSNEYPENVIAARKNLDPNLVARFTQVVTHMSANKKGQAVLKQMSNLKIQSFLIYDAGIEDMTKKLLAQGAF